MEFAVRHSLPERDTHSPETHRCPQCREQALVLHRRHVSPPRLGAALVTEYYACNFCDARYQFSPADNRWRPIYQ
jgi:uncharacterized protein with PIN domain